MAEVSSRISGAYPRGGPEGLGFDNTGSKHTIDGGSSHASENDCQAHSLFSSKIAGQHKRQKGALKRVELCTQAVHVST